MNAATIIATILSLVLATAAASSNSSAARPAPPRHNLNHNETFQQSFINLNVDIQNQLSFTVGPSRFLSAHLNHPTPN